MKKSTLFPLLFCACAFADEQAASVWNTDLAYACWADKHCGTQLALLHVQGTQRLIPGCNGTWLRLELSGSWGLDSRSVHHADTLFDNGASSSAHADYYGPHRLVLPEVALMHYFAGKRACLVAGMVNLANDVDAVGIANDSFATFAHSALVNSSVLPLPDANAGTVLRVDFSKNDYGVLALSRTGAAYGDNPFTGGPPGCCVVGEYGHVFPEQGITLRLNPFHHHHHLGVAASMEYEVDGSTTFFARTGCSHNAADFSCGATCKLIPCRPDDFVGVAYALTKADRAAADEAYRHRENIVEVVYHAQVTGRFKLMPHIQYTHRPAYNTGCRKETRIGVQGIFSF